MMQLAVAFWNVLRSRPLTALGALYWYITGRRVRARKRLRIGLAQRSDAYQRWIDGIERRDNIVQAAPVSIAGWAITPLFSIVVLADNRWTSEDFARLLAMMRSQAYPYWEVVVILPAAVDVQVADSIRVLKVGDLDESERLRTAVEAAAGDFILPMDDGAQLPPTALYRYAEALQTHNDAVMLFGDDDWIDSEGRRRDPWFKSEWNAELALAQDYVTGAMALSVEAAQNAFAHGLVGPHAPIYSLALAIAHVSPSHILHIPHIQMHLAARDIVANQTMRVAAVGDHLRRHGKIAVLVEAGDHGTIRVDHPLSVPAPSVSIIIPTRDKMQLLKACISSLLAKTQYPHFEILIVDNGSTQENALVYLNEIARHPSVRVIRDERPYNFSQLNNLAVGCAKGDYVCLLNNDTEIVDGEWLDVMMRQATRESIGAVGARLLYDDATIQHAGVAVGLGEAAGHPHRFQPKDAVGYFARTHAPHFVSAVTAACLVVSKDKFLAVGGLDENKLAIAFNDVDLCLKLQARGWRNIYTPYATLLHHESKSRGKDVSPQHIERYRKELATLQSRWGTASYLDPLHNPNLDRSNEHNLIDMTVAV